jgi:RNA polymerase sigma-70 factor (ECF subfamily)
MVIALEDDSQASFEALVGRYERPLLRFLGGLVQDPELAADLCQETFLAAFRSLPRLERGGDAELGRWLYTIALNHARGALRRRRVISWMPFLPAAHDRADACPDHSASIALRDELRAVLSRLPLDQRACLLLRADGFSYGDIAGTLGCTADAVRLRLFRARRACRAAYEQAGMGETTP